MRNVPRILPLVAVAIGGVLAVKLAMGAPNLLSGASAFAEGAGKPAKAAAKSDKPSKEGAAAPAASTDAPVPVAVAAKPAPICAPTAAELAKEAGLSPAELQVIQSLGVRRGQLDQREQGMDTQLQLIAAAEAKLDAKVAALQGLKGEITGLLAQANAKQDVEVDRLVKVFEGMKPKDSAARFRILDDAVRLPIAAKMKERALSAMLAQMPPEDAKKLTESLAARYAASTLLASAKPAAAPPAPAAAAAPAKPAAPAKTAASALSADATPTPETPVVKPAVRHVAKPHHAPAATKLAAAKPAGAKPAAASGAAGAAAAAPTAKPTVKADAGPIAKPAAPKPPVAPPPAKPAAPAAPAASARATPG